MFWKNLPKIFSRPPHSARRLNSKIATQASKLPAKQILRGDRIIFPQPRNNSAVFRNQLKPNISSVVKPNFLAKKNSQPNQNLLPQVPTKRKLKNRLLRIGILLIVLIIFGGLGLFAYQSKFWVINNVEFNQAWPSLPGLAEQLQQEYLGGNLLTINTDTKVRELKQNPYIKAIYFQKKIPNTLYVFIQEVKPSSILITLNKLQLLDQDGSVIKEISTTKPLSITESERLIYITPKVFRSPLLRAKWQSKEEVKLQSDFNKYLQTSSATIHPSPVIQPTPTISNSPTPTNSPIFTYEEYVAQKFLELNLADLNGLYQNLRSEVRLAIDTNWQELQAQIPDQKLPIIYSLVEKNELKESYLLSDNEISRGFRRQLDNRFIVKKIEIISPVSLRVLLDGMADSSNLCAPGAELYFNLNPDQSLVLQKLDTLLADLQSKKEHFNKIDLSGEKIIVA